MCYNSFEGMQNQRGCRDGLAAFLASMIERGTMMKKTLTQQDIQRELLAYIKQKRPLAVMMTVFAGLFLWVFFATLFTNGADLSQSVHLAVLVSMPIYCVIFLAVAFFVYYLDWLKIKKGKYLIMQEKLEYKRKGLVVYYRISRMENSLYFARGRLGVDEETFARAREGDRFYIITVRASKPPYAVYRMEDFVIQQDS